MLIIGLNYAPEPVGIGPYTQGLAEALAQRGAEVEAVVGQPYYPQWRPYPGFAKGWRRTREAGVKVMRCPHFVPADPGGIKRILHLVSFVLSALVPAISAALRGRDRRPGLVIAVAPALLGVITAWLAAKLAGARLWIHVQDFEVEAAQATGVIDGLPARLANRLESRLLRLGDQVSAISPQMTAKLAEKGVAPARISELRNWADVRFAPDPQGAANLRGEWQLGGRTVALYSGNIARKQGIEILIEAAKALRHRADITFVICGEGPNRAALDGLAEGLPNVLLRGLQPAERMGALLAMADLHLLPQIAGAADLLLPSKLTNMLASGRPVIATCVPGTGLYAEIEGCGISTAPGDAAALAGAIASLVDDPSRRAELGQTALKRAAERWSKASILDRAAARMAQLG